MKSITIRKIPPDLAMEIEEKARREGTTLAKAVIRLLLRATGLSRDGERRTCWSDVDALVGMWTRDEAAEFDQALGEQRRVDPEVWG